MNSLREDAAKTGPHNKTISRREMVSRFVFVRKNMIEPRCAPGGTKRSAEFIALVILPSTLVSKICRDKNSVGYNIISIIKTKSVILSLFHNRPSNLRKAQVFNEIGHSGWC